MSKHPLSAKNRIIVFAVLCVFIALCLVVFNYITDPFGALVTRENADEDLSRCGDTDSPAVESYEKNVPILMYHHLAEEGDGKDIISADVFEEQIKALSDAGYTAVMFSDLYDYVHSGKELPEKSVVITFDDGYMSNYTLAMPILEKYGMRATVFVIGVSFGRDTYKDTGVPIIPHFGASEAREMISSGIFDIQSHSYDMHQVDKLDDGIIRAGITQLEDESDEDYVSALRADCAAMDELFVETFGRRAEVFAYPYGFKSSMGSIILRENGIFATVTTERKSAHLVQGLPQSLFEMGRYFVTDELSGEALLELIK